jgi:ribA/ribD-fused uncharacterized protein
MIEERKYIINDVISFYRTNEKFGLLSNMKGRLMLHVNGMKFYSSEAIYQALKFSQIDIQNKIACEKSPIIAKRIAQGYKNEIRNDWERNKNNIMRLVLRIKALQCQDFCNLLLSTKDTIVEISRKDDYWGAKKINNDELFGKNVLGRLLMELREELKEELLLNRTECIILKISFLRINDKNITLESIL